MVYSSSEGYPLGIERLERIINSLVDELLKGGLIIGKTIVMDATFIKAYSKVILMKTAAVKLIVADSQYSSRNLRDQASNLGVKVVIPFPTNQQRGQKALLRVDKFFRTHGPTDEKRVYRFEVFGCAG